jgi:hypothetical protein
MDAIYKVKLNFSLYKLTLDELVWLAFYFHVEGISGSQW